MDGSMGEWKEYFGPQEHWQVTNDRWDMINQDIVNSRKVARPSNIDLSSVPKPKVTIISNNDEEDLVKALKIALGLVSLVTEHLLLHPFVVLRRQCQVNERSRKYHLVPITLVPVVCRLHRQQGGTAVWKGLGSVLVIQGVTLAIEDVLSKFTHWPNLTLSLITPFYSASLVETVQSDIASEKPGIFDVFKEGFSRLLSWNYPKKGRMLPVWSLVIPTVSHGLLKYLFQTLIHKVTYDYLYIEQKREHERQGALPRDSSQVLGDIEVNSKVISMLATEALLFPLETILHRLHLQGTRTIIDNLEDGTSVTPILTSYGGMMECYRTTIKQEGFAGLYKGFGALLLHFALYMAIVKLTRVLRRPSQPALPQPTLPQPTRPVQTPQDLRSPSVRPQPRHVLTSDMF